MFLVAITPVHATLVCVPIDACALRNCFRLHIEHISSCTSCPARSSRGPSAGFSFSIVVAYDLVSCRTSEGRQRPDLIIASSVRSVTIRPHSPTFNIVVVDLTLTHRFLHDDHDVNFTVTYSGVSTRLHESDQLRVSQAATLHRRAATL